MRFFVLAFVWLTGCLPALMGKGGGGYFHGTFETQGARMVLQESGSQVSGQVTASNLSGTIAASVSGYQMQGTVTLGDGSSGNFIAYATADGFELRLDGRQPINFKRVGAAPNVETPPANALDKPTFGEAMPASPSAPAARIDEKIPAPAGGPAKGAAYRDEMDGWEVRTPAAWKYVVKGNTVVFGSDTEAGIIFVSFNRGITYDQMVQGASAYLAQLGATQIGETTPFRAHGNQGVVVEMTGDVQGTQLRARTLGIAGPSGVVGVTALTTPEKLPALRKRADAIAMSARFFTPKQSPAMRYLAGPWWHYHGTNTGSLSSSGASSSYERTLELCADGRFFDSSASDIYVSTKSDTSGVDGWGNPYSGSSMTSGRNSQDAGSGRWTATGTNMQGQIRLLHNNGSVEEHTYVFKKPNGGDIELDGRWYGYAQDHGGKCN